jgi:hypothetical protein
MTLGDWEERLRHRVADMVRRGETSERRLARLTGYSQPHIHNALKGARRLHTELTDRLLAATGLGIGDLLQDSEEAREVVEVPVARGAVGPRDRFPETHPPAEFLPFAAREVSRYWEPLLVRAAKEEDSMAPLIEPGDLVMLDRSEGARRTPGLGSVWALAFGSRSAFARCQIVGRALVLVGDNSRATAPLPDHVPIARRDMLRLVRGRVVWVGRRLDLV